MLNRLTDVVKNLLIINVLAFVFTLPNHQFMGHELAVFYPGSPFFRPYQLVTHMFMHGSMMHIFFNMYGLVLLGPSLETRLGSKRFLVFYLVSGFGALLLHFGVTYFRILGLEQHLGPSDVAVVFDQGAAALQAGKNFTNTTMAQLNNIINVPMLGASGAIFGVLAGFGTMFPNVRLQLLFPPVTLTAKWFVLIYAGIELFLGVNDLQQGVAHFAHVGGALFGFLLLQYWRRHTVL